MKIFNILLFILLSLFIISCDDDDFTSEDCAGVSDGNNICGCMNSAAVNYNINATFDDGSCQDYADNGDYFLSFSLVLVCDAVQKTEVVRYVGFSFGNHNNHLIYSTTIPNPLLG